MKKFFNKFFSNSNKLINITCAILSVLVFVLCIFSIVAKVFGNKYTGSTNQMIVEDNYLTNDNYATEGSFIKREKVSFTKDADGSYGQTAVLEALNHLEKERERAYSEGGITAESNGITTAVASGVEVVQSMMLLCHRDITGDKYYEEATTEISSSGFGPTSAMSVYSTNDNARYELNENVKLNGKIVKGVFTGKNIKEMQFDKFIKSVGAFADIFPLGFTTDVSEIDLDSCKLTESIAGFKLSYKVKLDGNDFISNYAYKFGKAAGAVANSVKIKSFLININFNKYGQITNFDASYSFNLRKVVPVLGDVAASTTGGLSTNVTYKNADFRVKQI